MRNAYQQICPVLFGVGVIADLPEKVRELGGGRVLCICDAGLKSAGVADRLVQSLRDAGIETDLFDEVEADAPDTIINKAGEIVRSRDYGVVIGLGGGSSMDSAKAVALLAEKPGVIADYYLTAHMGERVKLILIPTTSGTGSEVTPMAVIHDTVNEIKAAIIRPADYAILDPALTVSVPPKVTAYTGMDALSHAVEAFTSAESCLSPHSDLLALEAVRLIAQNLKTAVEDGSDLAARSALAFASNIAGIAFSESSVHAGHAIAHEAGVRLSLPHGLICALATPVVIEYYAHLFPERMQRLAAALGVETAPEEAGAKAAAAVRALSKAVGIPSLKDLGVRREDAVDCAQGAVDHNIFIVTAPSPTGVPEIAEMLGRIYDQD